MLLEQYAQVMCLSCLCPSNILCPRYTPSFIFSVLLGCMWLRMGWLQDSLCHEFLSEWQRRSGWCSNRSRWMLCPQVFYSWSYFCFGMKRFRKLKYECWNKEVWVPEGLSLQKGLLLCVFVLFCLLLMRAFCLCQHSKVLGTVPCTILVTDVAE